MSSARRCCRGHSTARGFSIAAVASSGSRSRGRLDTYTYMVQVDVSYEGSLRCVARHGPSGATLTTDAPVDNMGRGAAFSPTDLVATALGTCMLTIMGIVAQRHNIDISGATVSVTKEMAALPVRRIGRLTV